MGMLFTRESRKEKQAEPAHGGEIIQSSGSALQSMATLDEATPEPEDTDTSTDPIDSSTDPIDSSTDPIDSSTEQIKERWKEKEVPADSNDEVSSYDTSDGAEELSELEKQVIEALKEAQKYGRPLENPSGKEVGDEANPPFDNTETKLNQPRRGSVLQSRATVNEATPELEDTSTLTDPTDSSTKRMRKRQLKRKVPTESTDKVLSHDTIENAEKLLEPEKQVMLALKKEQMSGKSIENPPRKEIDDEENPSFGDTEMKSNQPSDSVLQSTATIDEATPELEVTDTPTDPIDAPTKRMRKRRRKKKVPADSIDEVPADSIDQVSSHDIIDSQELQKQQREIRAEQVMEALQEAEKYAKAMAQIQLKINDLEKTVTANARSGTMTSRAGSRRLAKGMQTLGASKAAYSRLKRKHAEHVQKANALMIGNANVTPLHAELASVVSMSTAPEITYIKYVKIDRSAEIKFELCECYKRMKTLVQHGVGNVKKLRTRIMADESYFENQTHNPNTRDRPPHIMMSSEFASFTKAYTIEPAAEEQSSQKTDSFRTERPGSSVSAKSSKGRTSDFVMERMNKDKSPTISVLPDNKKSWQSTLVNLSCMTYLMLAMFCNEDGTPKKYPLKWLMSLNDEGKISSFAEEWPSKETTSGKVTQKILKSNLFTTSASVTSVETNTDHLKSMSAIETTSTTTEQTTSSPKKSPSKENIGQKCKKSIEKASENVLKSGLEELKKKPPTPFEREIASQLLALSRAETTSTGEDENHTSPNQKKIEEEDSKSLPTSDLDNLQSEEKRKILGSIDFNLDTMEIKFESADGVQSVLRAPKDMPKKHVEGLLDVVRCISQETSKESVPNLADMESEAETITLSTVIPCNKSLEEVSQNVPVSPESPPCTAEAETSFSDPPAEQDSKSYVPCGLHPLSPYIHKRPLEHRECFTGFIMRLMKKRTHFFAKIGSLYLDICDVCGEPLTKKNLGLPIYCIACYTKIHIDCLDDLFELCTPAPALSLEDRQREHFALRECVNPEFKPLIPPIILKITFLVMYGDEYRTKHLYRNPETDTKFDKFKKLLKQGCRPNLLTMEPLLLGELLKYFLSSLKPRLITKDIFKKLKACLKGSTGGPVNIDNFRKAFVEISDEATRETLIFIFMHLQDVSSMKEVEMPAAALARAFTPVLVEGFQREQSFKYFSVIEEILRLPIITWQSLFSYFVEGLDI